MKFWMKRIMIISMLFIIIFITACNKNNEVNNTPQVTNIEEEKQTVEAFGIVKAVNKRNIILDFPSYIEKVHIKEGQRVNKGDILITLNIDDFQGEIMNKEKELNIMKLEREKIQNEIYEKEKNNPQMQKLLNDVKHAENSYEQSKKDFESKKKLYNAGSISKLEFEDCEKELQAKQKSVEDARYDLEIMNDSKKEEIVMLKIKSEQIKAKENDLKVLKDKLNKSYIKENTIISNIENGVAYDIGYIEGDIISSDKKILSIMDLDSIVIEAEIPEEFIKDVKIGAEVIIVPLVDKSKEYKGKVISIASTATQKKGETIVPVEISIDGYDSLLLPNFNVDVTIFY